MVKFLSTLLLFSSFFVCGQKRTTSIAAKEYLSKNPPPNGILLERNLYMDETEIGNIHYLEYLFRLKNDSSEFVYNQALPYNHDLTWSSIPKDSINVKKYYQEDRYLRYPGFRYFPVVGITKEQAIKYAHWRSEIVTKTINNRLEKSKSPFRIYYKYRLPTEAEWEKAASGKLNPHLFPFGMEFTKRPNQKSWIKRFEKGEMVPDSALFLQFNCLQPGIKPKAKFKTTEYIYSYEPNGLGFYNMTGNIAEMVSDSNFAKGGSWMHPKDHCKIFDRQFYYCPVEWLGFRCVCEVFIDEIPLENLIASKNTPGLDSCKFIEKRRKADHIPNTQKLFAAFTIKDNNAFNIKINDVVIFEKDTIRKKTDLKGKVFKKQGFAVQPLTTDAKIEYDFYKVELVGVNGPYVTSTEIKDKSGKMLISTADSVLSYDYIVVTIYKKEKGFGGFLTYSVARKI